MAAGDYTGYADYLAGLLPGLCVQVARAWLAAEGGGPGANNPLNVTRTASGLDQGYTGRFANYPSVEVGLQAAAWLVMHGLYAGIRAALPTHSPQIQRLAIIGSVWAAGHYHAGASFPSVSGPCQAPSGAPTGIVQASDTTPSQPINSGLGDVTVAQWLEQTFGWGADRVLTADDVAKVTAYEKQAAPNQATSVLDQIVAGLGIKVGATVGSLTGSVNVQPPVTTHGIDLNPFDALAALLPGFLVDAALIGLILLLGYRGLTTLLE